MFSGKKTILNQHKFWIELVDNKIAILKKAEKIGLDTKSGKDIYFHIHNSDKFSESEKVTLKTEDLVQEANFKIDKIQMALFLLDTYPYYGVWDVPLTQGEYIEYHMEAYLIHSLGLQDRVLEMVHFVCGLSLPKKKRRESDILNAIKDLPIAHSLMDFLFLFSEIRRSRNEVVHKYRFNTSKLSELIAEDILVRSKYYNDRSRGESFMRSLNIKYETFQKDLFKTLYENDELLSEKYALLMDDLFIQYKNKLSVLE